MSVNPCCGLCEQPLNASMVSHKGGESHPFHTTCASIFREVLEKCPVCNIPKEQLQFEFDKPIHAKPIDIDWNDPVCVENRMRVASQQIREASGFVQAVKGFLQHTRLLERMQAAKAKIPNLPAAQKQMAEEDVKFIEKALSLFSKTAKDVLKTCGHYQTEMTCLDLMHHLNLLNPLQIDRLIEERNKSIRRCADSLTALERCENLSRSDEKKLSTIAAIRKIYQKIKAEEEGKLQFLLQTKRHPPDTAVLVLLDTKITTP